MFKPLFLECVLLLTSYILNIPVSVVHFPPPPQAIPPGWLAPGGRLAGFVAGWVLCRMVEGWMEEARLFQSYGGFSMCLLGDAMSCLPTTVDLGEVRVNCLLRTPAL